MDKKLLHITQPLLSKWKLDRTFDLLSSIIIEKQKLVVRKEAKVGEAVEKKIRLDHKNILPIYLYNSDGNPQGSKRRILKARSSLSSLH